MRGGHIKHPGASPRTYSVHGGARGDCKLASCRLRNTPPTDVSKLTLHHSSRRVIQHPMAGSGGIRWTQHSDGYRWIQHDERDNMLMAATLVGESPTQGIPRGWWNEPAPSEPASATSAMASPRSLRSQPSMVEKPFAAPTQTPPNSVTASSVTLKLKSAAKTVNRRHFQPGAGKLRALRAECDGTWLRPATLPAFANNAYSLNGAAALRPVTAFVDTTPRAPPLLSPRPPSPQATTAAGYRVERASRSPSQSPRIPSEGYYMHASAKRLLPLRLARQSSTKLRHAFVDPPRTPRPLSAMVASSPRARRAVNAGPNTADSPLRRLGLV